MENPRTGDGQKISFIPKFSKVFFNNNGRLGPHYEIFGRGGNGSNRLLLLCLAVLNVVLLLVAVVLGINCVKVKEGSFHVSHSAVKQLTDELDYLRSNHSDVIEAEVEAKNQLDNAIKKHAQLKTQIEQQKTVNDGFQRQIETMYAEKANLKSNISALEGSCGKCLSGWTYVNSSCYFFSYTESSSVKKKWADSRADCVSRGADLIVINNQEEQTFVSDTIQTMRSGRNIWENGFWIGLTDSETEGTWVWINNVTEVEQRYWMTGEPNDRGRHGEDCGAVVYSSSNPWKTRFDAPCDDESRHWICETRSN